MLQLTLPAGFISPCLPTRTNKLPSGSEWLHEIKHDGFRVIARQRRTGAVISNRSRFRREQVTFAGKATAAR
jgi:ATP-dependent DNA ligase